jgi:hypothetical protein
LKGKLGAIDQKIAANAEARTAQSFSAHAEDNARAKRALGDLSDESIKLQHQEEDLAEAKRRHVRRPKSILPARMTVAGAVAASAECTYDETVSSQSMEGIHEASSFVARIVALSRRCVSHRLGGRTRAKFDAERHLQ